MHEAAASRVLCRVLDFQREALDFYAQAKERCPGQLVREIFATLERDKRRLGERLASVYAAIQAGLNLASACTLTDNGHTAPSDDRDGVPARPHAAVGCVEEARMLARAFQLEDACLHHLEQALQQVADPEVRFFLQQALEEERRHWLLLSDLRQYVDQSAGTSGKK